MLFPAGNETKYQCYVSINIINYKTHIMKAITATKWIPAILLLCISMQVFPQTAPTDYYSRLYYLCKAWGHAKYYHTEIAKGPSTVNWDEKLLTAITEVKNAPTVDNTAFNAAVLKMLNSAGTMRTSKTALPVVPDDLNLNKDQSWIDAPIFSDAVKLNLKNIWQKFRPHGNYYVGQAFTDGNPTFDKDNLYNSDTNISGSEGKKLLGLFRYWNIINYFYPYKKLMDQTWDATLAEYIPQVAVENAGTFFLLGMFNRLNDAHAGMGSTVAIPGNTYYYAPFQIRFIEGQTVITKLLPGTNLAVGDVITKIGNEDINDFRSRYRLLLGSSTPQAVERRVDGNIMVGKETLFDITVSSADGTLHTESITRNTTNNDELKINNSPVWWKTTTTNGCTFGIVDMGRLETTQVSAMFAELWNTSAIIFDVRNYPKGTLWTIVNYLFPGPIHTADLTVPDITYPGRLCWKSTYIGTGTTNPYTGKVIILHDDRTMSQAEYTCMGLENFPDAIKIGSKTIGADGNVSTMYLPGNLSATMTGLGVFYPDHTPTQRIGIIPDYEVHPTIAGIRAGQDEVMDFALTCPLLSHPAPLVAAFTASQVNVVAGTTVNFTDLSTGYPAPATWSWSFPGGNPETSTVNNPLVTYSTPGTYDVTLTVTRTGASNTVTKTGFINVREISNILYCLPHSISSSTDYIQTVSFTGAFTNNSGATNYKEYTGPYNLTPGKTYPVTLTPSNSTYWNYWKIWIDFNQDGDFNDTGEVVLTVNKKRGSVSSSIVIPAGASGATRMRISMRSGAAPGPCDDGFIGEVEDYNIILGSSGLKQASITRSLNNNLKIYPNPVSWKLTIELNEISSLTELSIYSMEGKLLRKEWLTSNLTIIDVSKWNSGIYLVRVTCGGFNANQKFVKN
jgi:carboxyl-terminal processing protease